MTSGLLVPGWGAPASLYVPGLPVGWRALELPTFRQTKGSLDSYRAFLGEAISAERRPVKLAGHSMGAALAVLAALDQPQLVERLILLSPAGLRLDKSLGGSARTFLGQVRRGSYPAGALWRMTARAASAPRAALALARAVHDLDLTPELGRLRTWRVPCTVVACTTDELTTCAHCRRLAGALDAEYRELGAVDGHIWPITRPELLARELLGAPAVAAIGTRAG